jgi:hypothetical protein
MKKTSKIKIIILIGLILLIYFNFPAIQTFFNWMGAYSYSFIAVIILVGILFFTKKNYFLK